MYSKQKTGQKLSPRVNKKRRATRAATGITKRTFRAPRKPSTNDAKRALNKNGAPGPRRRAAKFRYPKSELEVAVQRFIDLYDFAPIAYVSFNYAGRIEEANLPATELFGVPRDLLIGRPFAFYVADLDLFMQHLLYCRTSQQRVETELELKPRKGEKIPALLWSTPVTSTMRNGALLYQTAIMDLRERKRHEQQLAEQARLLDLSTDAIMVRDKNDRITYWNNGATTIYGYTRQEALGKVCRNLLKSEYLEPLPKINEKLLRNNRWQGEIVHTRADGRRLTVSSRWSLDRDAQGNRAYVLETNNDITQRKKTEAALKESKKLLERRVVERTRELNATNKELESEIQRRKGLEGEILSVSDREQQRLGQELHDGLCQHLTAVAFMTRSIALRLRDHRVIDAADIENVADLINKAAVDTRNLSRALHRLDVDAAGLVTALQDLVDREIWRTSCRLEVKPSFHIDDDAVAAHLFRIAREAVINANKHAQPRQIVVALERLPGETVLRVIDDGIGFPKDFEPRQGLGYHIMKYRAQLLGGRLEIDSPKKGGTRVSCHVPNHTPHLRQSNGKRDEKPWRLPVKIRKALATLV